MMNQIDERLLSPSDSRGLDPSRQLCGQWLLSKRIISKGELTEGLRIQQEKGEYLGEVLFSLLGGNRTALLGEAVAELIGYPWIRADQFFVPEELLAQVPARFATHYHILPVNLDQEGLHVASDSPQNTSRLDELSLLLGVPVIPRFAFNQHIDAAIKTNYGLGADTIERMGEGEESQSFSQEEDIHEADVKEASIIRFVNQLILDAWKINATDIHLEPGEGIFSARYRVDGSLQHVKIPEMLRHFRDSVIARIKVMARLNIAEQRLPQDGRIQFQSEGQRLDLRVSVLPTPLGEAVNLRLLRRGTVALDLNQLGYSGKGLDQIIESTVAPNGIILITGPTGSGKTTTLYALLTLLSRPNIKILTIEDPIEYRLASAVQMQVHEEIGFDFSRALRSILRHDPDVILVGEIRDQETASIAIRMSITGHLVLSTLHTNSASATAARLIDMDLEPYLLASSLNLVVAQRLARRLCVHCRRPMTVEELSKFPETKGYSPDAEWSLADGCDSCRNSGYSGRTVVYEILKFDSDFRRMITDRASSTKFEELMANKNIRALRDHGLELAADGVTTLEEVYRLTRNAD